MKRRFINISRLLIALSLVLLIGCKKEIDYQTLVETNLSLGQEFNDIIYDIKFGMTSDEFYDYCRELNKEYKAEQGPKKRTVQIEVDGFSEPCYMLFYPNFINDEIAEMPILFALHQWSPWNKESYSDDIIYEVRDLIEDWYDMDLHLLIDTTDYPGFVGCKGNKKVTLTIQNDQFVKLLVTDMLRIDPETELVYKRN